MQQQQRQRQATNSNNNKPQHCFVQNKQQQKQTITVNNSTNNSVINNSNIVNKQEKQVEDRFYIDFEKEVKHIIKSHHNKRQSNQFSHQRGYSDLHKNTYEDSASKQNYQMNSNTSISSYQDPQNPNKVYIPDCLKTSQVSSGEFGLQDTQMHESAQLQQELLEMKSQIPLPEKQERIYFDNENIQDSDDGEVSVISNVHTSTKKPKDFQIFHQHFKGTSQYSQQTSSLNSHRYYKPNSMISSQNSQPTLNFETPPPNKQAIHSQSKNYVLSIMKESVNLCAEEQVEEEGRFQQSGEISTCREGNIENQLLKSVLKKMPEQSCNSYLSYTQTASSNNC